MRKNEIKIGVILSYALLIINTLYGLLIAPYILRTVGGVSYGVYKSVASLSASLAVMDMGLGATTTRYMARFHAKNENAKAGNFLAMVFLQYAGLTLLIVGVGCAVYLYLPTMYSQTFSHSELSLAKTLVSILILNMLLRLFENLLSGVLNGYERFKISNGVKLASVITKFSLILFLLPMTKSVITVVFLETIVVSCVIIFFFLYVIRKLKVIPKLIKWDNQLFKESLGYTALMFVQTITIQFNGNVDNVIIGSKIGPMGVTIYSFALTIFGMYENLSGSIANIMLPNMTKRVLAGECTAEIQRGVERAGRFQFMLLSAALGGFLVLGKDFYALWLGEGFSDCYYLTLILILPVTLPMCQNVCLSVLRAQNKMVYRTVTLAISCMINIAVTLIGVKIIGYYGAAIGTACSTICNFVMMNLYYHKQIGFKIIPLFMRIIGKTLPCAMIAGFVTYIFHMWVSGGWMLFFVNALLFCFTYLLLLFFFGFNTEERERVFRRVKRRKT